MLIWVSTCDWVFRFRFLPMGWLYLTAVLTHPRCVTRVLQETWKLHSFVASQRTVCPTVITTTAPEWQWMLFESVLVLLHTTLYKCLQLSLGLPNTIYWNSVNKIDVNQTKCDKGPPVVAVAWGHTYRCCPLRYGCGYANRLIVTSLMFKCVQIVSGTSKSQ